jgi:hypothetical protein
MKENDLLRAKFKAKGYEMISEFIRGCQSDITQESWGKVLKRDKPVSTELWLRMAGELGCTPEEIKGMMLARGEKVIAELVAPASMSVEDRKFLNKLHDLNGDPKKLKLIADMMDSLKG